MVGYTYCSLGMVRPHKRIGDNKDCPCRGDMSVAHETAAGSQAHPGAEFVLGGLVWNAHCSVPRFAQRQNAIGYAERQFEDIGS